MYFYVNSLLCLVSSERRRALTNSVASVTGAVSNKIFHKRWSLQCASCNDHLPADDVWEHFYIFPRDCATAVTPVQWRVPLIHRQIGWFHFTFHRCSSYWVNYLLSFFLIDQTWYGHFDMNVIGISRYQGFMGTFAYRGYVSRTVARCRLGSNVSCNPNNASDRGVVRGSNACANR